MASKIKVNNIQDTGSNDIITSDGAGNVTVNTSLNFGDNDKAQFGASNDLQIFHDTTDSWIQDRGTGNLKLGSNGVGVEIRRKTDSADESMAVFNNNGSVDLYYDNSKKLETTSTGATVTGTLTADGLSLGDSEYIQLGASNDLQIYHDGSNSYINEQGTGNLLIRASSAIRLQRHDGTENFLTANQDGSVELYHNGSKKLETTSGGVDVTGDLSVSGNLLTRKFFAYGKNTNGTASGWRTIDFQTEVEDDDSRFTHTSGTYTVGESGTFLLVAGHHHTNGTHSEYQIRFHSNVHGFLAGMGTTNSDMISISMFHEATLNEVIKVQVYHSNTNHTDAGGRHSFFGGYLVK